MNPKDLKKWLFLLAILYLVFPRDLIPDSLGRGFGLIDDIALMGLLTHYFRRYARSYVGGQGSGKNRQHQNQHQNEQQHQHQHQHQHQKQRRAGAAGRDTSNASLDPYSILGVAPGASQEEIQSAYRARMREYHPDKVTHLGKDLQKLAHRRSVEIQQAYQRLRNS